MYRLHIDDRNYESFSVYDSTNMDKVELPADFNPLTHHLFTNDLFSLSTDKEKVELLHSNVRNYEYISGVLVLENDKTYGLNDKQKYYYKCIPDDIHLPTFLIPYERKHIGFSKIYKNHYITFKFMQWRKNGSSGSNSKPIGQIVQNIGPVDILDNFYEYQLYCKSLNSSIQKLTKDTLASIKTNTSNIDKIKELYQLEERTDVEIFSIDPQGSVDFDDAFSIKEMTSAGDFVLSIYISNVTIWLDYLNLWPSMSNRISTIYLPDRKRPMLPTVLSDCLCSLQQGEKRFALTMDLNIYFDFDKSSMVIREIKYSNSIIQVKKNYVYDEPTLLVNTYYKQLKEVVASLNKNPASKYINKVIDSHDVVEYLMVLMNHLCAQKLLVNGEGIFRCISSTATTELVDTVTNNLPTEIANFAHIWSSNSAGKYINVKNKLETESLSHSFLNLESYVHITSPIRRLVDLLNIIQFQLNFDFVLSEKAQEFYQYWTSIEKISYINTTTKSIKKVQNECNLLHLCTSDPTILEKVWNGYVFDIVEYNNGLFQYIIYIHELKIFGKIVLGEKLALYSKGQFKLFIFNNEAKMKKKIRLQYIYNGRIRIF